MYNRVIVDSQNIKVRYPTSELLKLRGRNFNNRVLFESDNFKVVATVEDFSFNGEYH